MTGTETARLGTGGTRRTTSFGAVRAGAFGVSGVAGGMGGVTALAGGGAGATGRLARVVGGFAAEPRGFTGAGALAPRGVAGFGATTLRAGAVRGVAPFETGRAGDGRDAAFLAGATVAAGFAALAVVAGRVALAVVVAFSGSFGLAGVRPVAVFLAVARVGNGRFFAAVGGFFLADVLRAGLADVFGEAAAVRRRAGAAAVRRLVLRGLTGRRAMSAPFLVI